MKDVNSEVNTLSMRVQLIKDSKGKRTGVFIPIKDWEELAERHQELKELIATENIPKTKLSELAGLISHATAEAMINQVQEDRREWEKRLDRPS